VGDVSTLGQQDYSMRAWIDPEKLASRNLAANDVSRVLREQNVQVAAGRLGAPPVPTGQVNQITLTTLGRLIEAEQFESIVLKTGSDGQVTYLRDVARVELGAKNMDVQCRLDGGPAVGLAIFQLPGSNALNVADAIRARMKELEKRFPPNLAYAIVYDTTPFVRESVIEVLKTLRDAVILVCLVVLFFLQDWRSVILPLIDVIVSLVGTFAVMYVVSLLGNAVGVPALQFSLNNLTLFGLVLAIGIVVDDAIVVLENIERWMGMGYPVREATINAMNEITGPILAITLVLASVFLPSAFLGGITGQFYRQFALTIAAAMIISAINAMTMTPARAGSVFGHRKPGAHDHSQNQALPWWGTGLLFGYLATFGQPLIASYLATYLGVEDIAKLTFPQWLMLTGLFSLPGALIGVLLYRPVNAILAVVFRVFNAGFDWVTRVYGRTVGWSLRLSVIVLMLYGGLIGLTVLGFLRIPVGFIPQQDKGYLLVNIELPPAASLERTTEVVARVEKVAKSIKGVKHTLSVPGMSFVLGGAVSSNWASIFVILDEFEHRHDHHQSADAIALQLRGKAYQEINDAMVVAFGAPAVDGLGNAGGFKLMVQDRGDLGLQMLAGQASNLAEKGNQVPGLVGLFNGFRADTPQKYLDIDRVKCKTLGLALDDVFNTLQIFLGGAYVNDFNRFGRTWQVNIQAEAAFRLNEESIRNMKVRNATGEMIPLGTVINVVDVNGPVLVNRYNMFPAAPINGASLPGVSSGTVIREMEELANAELNPAMGYEWTELTFLEKRSGFDAIFAFIGAVLLVYLVLAALYESWALPMAVLLVVPMCLLSALAGIAMARMDINIFVQVGFIVLVGLAAKNAILIVEFAEDKRHREGASVFDAAVDACVTRLRPIIMTSFAFILGVVPLVIAEGAGAEMRRTLGVAVFSGMLGVTFFGLFLTPVFYYVIMRNSPTPTKPGETAPEGSPTSPESPSEGAIQPSGH
jgi:multidrug efflux pump